MLAFVFDSLMLLYKVPGIHPAQTEELIHCTATRIKKQVAYQEKMKSLVGSLTVISDDYGIALLVMKLCVADKWYLVVMLV